jgi:hypothetical protein
VQEVGQEKHTCEEFVALRPKTEVEYSDKPADLLETAETGSALENSMVGGITGGWAGSSARIAALEMQSVVPQANSPMRCAGCFMSGQYVWPGSQGETTITRRITSEVAGGKLKSDTVNARTNTVPTGAFAVSMPHPESPLRNNSWPGQLNGMQERGGQERMRLETSPSSSSHAVAPSRKAGSQAW